MEVDLPTTLPPGVPGVASALSTGVSFLDDKAEDTRSPVCRELPSNSKGGKPDLLDQSQFSPSARPQKSRVCYLALEKALQILS